MLKSLRFVKILFLSFENYAEVMKGLKGQMGSDFENR